MTSFARKILEEISVELGKPKDSVEKFIQTLEDNWYDSKEALS